jgi:hypothetical protein
MRRRMRVLASMHLRLREAIKMLGNQHLLRETSVCGLLPLVVAR